MTERIKKTFRVGLMWFNTLLLITIFAFLFSGWLFNLIHPVWAIIHHTALVERDGQMWVEESGEILVDAYVHSNARLYDPNGVQLCGGSRTFYVQGDPGQIQWFTRYLPEYIGDPTCTGIPPRGSYLIIDRNLEAAPFPFSNIRTASWRAPVIRSEKF